MRRRSAVATLSWLMASVAPAFAADPEIPVIAPPAGAVSSAPAAPAPGLAPAPIPSAYPNAGTPTPAYPKAEFVPGGHFSMVGHGIVPNTGFHDVLHGAPPEAHSVWFRGEYLLWWVKDGNTVPLATTGPVTAGGLAGPGGGNSVGAVDTPGTTFLNDGHRLSDNPLSGGRFTLGSWCGVDRTCGAEVTYFFLGRDSFEQRYSSETTPVIARPFFNFLDGLTDSEVVAAPGFATGTLRVTSSTRLQGIEGNYVEACVRNCRGKIEGIAGFRYINLDESLHITENLQLTNNQALGVLAGSQIGVRDAFSTRNDFYGGQVGVRGEQAYGRLTLDAGAKVAIGGVHQESRVDGRTVVTQPGRNPVSLAGGLLALPSNSGSISRDRFAVAPELTVNVGYQINDRLRAFMGYNLLYLSSVARPGDQISDQLNVTQVPTNLQTFGQLAGEPSPTQAIRSTDFWAQGINFGLHITY